MQRENAKLYAFFIINKSAIGFFKCAYSFFGGVLAELC